MKDFDRGGREASLQLLACKLIGNAVIMTVDFDVVINVGADGFSTGDDITFGGQRLENGLVDFGEQGSASAFPFSKSTMIQLFQQFADSQIQIRQREEPLRSQGRHYPALCHENRIFNFGFVVSHQMQVVWELPWADSGSPIRFIRFVGLNTNWLPEG